MIRKGSFKDAQLVRLQDSIDEALEGVDARLLANPLFNGELHVLDNPTLPGSFTLRHTLGRVPQGVYVVDVSLSSLTTGASPVGAWRHGADAIWTDKLARVTVSSPGTTAVRVALWLW